MGDQPQFASGALAFPVDNTKALQGELELNGGWLGTESPPNSGIIIIPAVPNPAVARVTFSLQDLNPAEIITIKIENDVGAPSTTFLGTDTGDTLTATNTDSLIRGRGGDDTIDMSAGGVNTVIFETTQALNGTDTITGFSVAPDTALPDRIGFGGLTNADLRGTGTEFEALATGGALGADTGFVVITTQLGGLAADDLSAAAAGLSGEGAGDVIYLLASDGTDAALARVTYSAVDTATAEVMANFTGLGDVSGIGADQILGFTQAV